MSITFGELNILGAFTPGVASGTHYSLGGEDVDPDENEFMDSGSKKIGKNNFNIFLIAATAIVFIIVVSWFNILARWIEDVHTPNEYREIPNALRPQFHSTHLAFIYAIAATTIGVAIICILYCFM